jgi:hypothetical protein
VPPAPPRCTLQVFPSNINVTTAQATTVTVKVTATPAGCVGPTDLWTATSQTGWVAVSSVNTGAQPGVVVLSVSAYGGRIPRHGTLTIAGASVPISQVAASSPGPKRK